MHAEPLFPDTERTDPEQCRANESNYGFLQRVDDPVFANVRAVFNEWFGRFAKGQVDEAIRDLRNRFKGKGSEQFYGAFWELYLHETLVRLGFEIKVHPKSERGTRPDFVLARGDERLCLEAVSLFPGFSDHKEPQNVDTVIEYVSEAFDPKWRFRLRHVFAGKQSPRRRPSQTPC